MHYADKNQLQAIYVLPEYQHQGIGTMLWQALCKSFDVSMPTIVQVATYNKQAIVFYEKLGFTDTGKRWQDDKFRMKSGVVIPEMEMEIVGN